MIKTGLLFLCSALLFLNSCRRAGNECNGVACTEEFRSIGVQLKTPTDSFYVPQKVQVITDKGKLLNEESKAGSDSLYTLVDDSHIADIRLNINRTFNIKIFKANKVVKQQTFVVRADCCHIEPVDVPAVIVVE